MDAEYLQNSSFGSAYSKWKYFTNKDFQELDQQVINLLKTVWKYHDNFSETTLGNFFQCKSQWVETFKETYSSGDIQGGCLTGTYLPFERPNDEVDREKQDAHYYLKEPIVLQWDVSTYDQRIAAAKGAKQNLEKVGKILDGLEIFILRHCALEMMLHRNKSIGVQHKQINLLIESDRN
jgi:hypothetical protein